MTLCNTKPEFAIGSWALNSENGQKFRVLYMSDFYLENSSYLPANYIEDCSTVPNPRYSANSIDITHLKNISIDGSISIQFEVSINGETSIQGTTPSETKYIHNAIIRALGDNYADYSSEYIALEKACEIYYSMIA